VDPKAGEIGYIIVFTSPLYSVNATAKKFLLLLYK